MTVTQEFGTLVEAPNKSIVFAAFAFAPELLSPISASYGKPELAFDPGPIPGAAHPAGCGCA